MQKPQKHDREKERLRALKSYNILDTMPEEEYDALTRFATMFCNVPVSLISLIDKERQWFKSKQGIDFSETSRDLSFCAHAIHDEHTLLEVKDARQDKRFSENDLVTGDVQIVFYAGMPILNDKGLPLGTICVIDNEPRQLTDHQREMLKELANYVSLLLKKRKEEYQLRKRFQMALETQDQVTKRLHEQHEALTAMSTPVTQLWKGVLLLPLVGYLDSKRSRDVMETVLSSIEKTQAKVFILDISGIAVVDTAVANYFIKINKAVKLMGTACYLSGISGAVAQTVVELGIQVNEIKTTGTMREALLQALGVVGAKIVTIA